MVEMFFHCINIYSDFMSLTRTKYDACEYRTELQESRGPGSYMMNTPKAVGRFPIDPNIRAQRGSVSQKRFTQHRYYDGPVDVESDLKNINRHYGRCPSQQFQGDRSIDFNMDEPVMNFTVEDTRLSNPTMTLKGRECGHWSAIRPMHDPQATVFMSMEHSVPTRLVMRDNHRPYIRTPAINNMNPTSS